MTADVVRIGIVAAFVVLAIALPPILEARARLGRAHEAHELGAFVWLIFAAGIAATLAGWGQPLNPLVTVLRAAAGAVGLHYVWANRRLFRR